VQTGRWVNRLLGLACWVGLLALLGGAVLLVVVLLTQGVDRAGTWASVLGTGLAIGGSLVALVTWRLQRRSTVGQFVGGVCRDSLLESPGTPQPPPVVSPALDLARPPPAPPINSALQSSNETFKQSQPIQGRTGDDTHDGSVDWRVMTGRQGRRSGVGGYRIGVTVGLVVAAIGLLTAVGFLISKLHEEPNNNVSGFVAYNFDQGISADAQAKRYVTDITGHGHLGYLKTDRGGDLTVIDHPGQGKAVHFPAPCTLTPTITCPLALIQTTRADDLNPGTQNFSYGADVLMKSTETQPHASIMQKGPEMSPGGEWKLQIEATGRPSCVIFGKDSPRNAYRAAAAVSVADDSWHKVQCVKTATVLSIYVDSISQRHVNLPAGLAIENGSPMSVGGLHADQVINSNQFFGALDNVYFDLGQS
jgi:Laminin G domain